MAELRGRCPVPGCDKIFKVGHSGIDAHVVSAHAALVKGTTKQDVYAAFKQSYPRPWPYMSDSSRPIVAGQVGPGVETNPRPLDTVPGHPEAGRRDILSARSLTARTGVQAPENGDLVIGVDFAGPGQAREQRQKILAVAAQRLGPGAYAVTADGFNARLAQYGPPGWTALELAEALEGPHRARVVALDFPFSIPASLLAHAAFAARVDRDDAFGSWQAFNAFVADRLPLGCPLDLSPFAGWRDKAYWLRRATDLPAQGQPALKHQFQTLFNMTLLGNALLARLGTTGGYRIDPFTPDDGQPGTLIEIYPGATMRRLGKPNYKHDPAGAIATMLAFCEQQGLHVEVAPAVRRRCETYGMDRKSPDPDGSDALIALCTAILFQEGLCEQLLDAPLDDRMAVEGAIWAPIVPLGLRQ